MRYNKSIANPMLTFALIKQALFSSETDQHLFLLALNSNESDFSVERFDSKFRELLSTSTEKDLQLTLAPFLRNKAINYIRESQTDCMQRSREICMAVYADGLDGQTWEAFLTHQNINKVHATYLEAAALGDLFGLNIQATSITNGLKSNQRSIIYDEAEGRPTIHFYCVDNRHWHIKEDDYYGTIPDGNCLYNGFAQWLRILTEPDLTLFNAQEKIARIIGFQLNILNQISESTPSRLMYQTIADNVHVVAHSESPLALQVALDDMQSLNALRKTLLLCLGNEKSTLEEVTQYCDQLTQYITNQEQTKEVLFHRSLINSLNGYWDTHKKTLNEQQLTEFKTFLYHTVGVMCQPSSLDISTNWTTAKHKQNTQDFLALLKTITQSPINDYQRFGWNIHQIIWQHPASPFKTSNTPPFVAMVSPSSTWDYISPTLRLAGLAMIVAGLVSLVVFFLMIIASHFALLSTTALMTASLLKTIMAFGGSALGISSPTVIGISVSLGSISLIGLGFTLFKQFPSPQRGEDTRRADEGNLNKPNL